MVGNIHEKIIRGKIFLSQQDTNHYVPLCMGGSKGKAGIHLKSYPDNRDTFEM